MKLIAYYRVSTGAQGDSGLGLEAQQAAVQAHALGRGDEIVKELVEVASGGNDSRILLGEALNLLAAGEADGLIVAKLDRLARSIAQVDHVLTLSQKQGWRLVALDLGVDTETAAGRLVTNVLAAVAQWERETIGERTKVALEAARERGVVLGRPRDVSEELVAEIGDMRTQGYSLREIAEHLNETGVPTARGGAQWHPSTVRGILAQRA